MTWNTNENCTSGFAGLFHRAILISGSVLSPWALQRKPEDIASQVSVQMGCVGRLPLGHPESDLAPCLRRKHLSDLMNFVPESPRFLSPFAPFVDNILIRNPKVVMEKDPVEQFKRSELIIVFTTSESAHELNKHELTHGFEADHKDRILRTLVRNVFSYHQQEIFSIVKNEYTDWERPIPHPIPLRDSTVEALSDCLVIAPALQVALIHGRRGAKTHLLHFSHVSREYDFSSYEVKFPVSSHTTQIKFLYFSRFLSLSLSLSIFALPFLLVFFLPSPDFSSLV